MSPVAMTVRARLLLTWATIAGILVLPALHAANRLADVREIAVEQRNRHAESFLRLGRLNASLAGVERFLRSYVAAPGADLHQALSRAMDDARRHLDQIDSFGYRDATGASRRALDSLHAAIASIEAMVAEGDLTRASKVFEETRPILRSVDTALLAIAAAIDRQSASDLENARLISAATARATFSATLLAAAFALALGLWATRALVAPLLRLRSAVAAVASGEFVASEDLPYERRDEIGDLARSFRATTEQLARLERLRAEFLSMAGHDLRTPLSVIAGYTELIEDGLFGEINEEQGDALVTIREQTYVVAGLVDRLVDMGRLQAGGLSIEKCPTDVRALLDGVGRAFAALAERRKIDFSVHREPSTPTMILADADRLRDQVLGNLLGNAFKFTPAGGEIRLHTHGEGDRLVLEVRDTGPGIPEDQLPLVFEKFYQVGAAGRDVGAGLGLAIARDVVHAHGGTIEVESAPGQGATFRVRLPVLAFAPANG